MFFFKRRNEFHKQVELYLEWKKGFVSSTTDHDHTLRWFSQVSGKLDIVDVTSHDLEKFLEIVQASCTPFFVTRNMRHLKGIFKYYHARGYKCLPENSIMVRESHVQIEKRDNEWYDREMKEMRRNVPDIEGIKKFDEYRKKGLNNTEIAKVMGKKRRTITRWKKYLEIKKVTI